MQNQFFNIFRMIEIETFLSHLKLFKILNESHIWFGENVRGLASLDTKKKIKEKSILKILKTFIQHHNNAERL